ncbi:Alpha-galactosidase 2 [Hibiscus syriacus]|uniref:Alpha-galactosidase 2 n=1 Tax=Hibiscus syriacus TaxID=106335 RepID=A0A6A3BFS7_HIBSY|nr:Alpha-galactosidase 2 [Hibiscus syriacus]
MLQTCLSSAKNLSRKLVRVPPPPTPNKATAMTRRPTCDVFINHRGIDTKRTIAGLLHDHLSGLGLRPFLDSRSSHIFAQLLRFALLPARGCPFDGEQKRVIPIFCDVKPSQLQVMDYGICSAEQLERFNWALEEAKQTVGLAFDTVKGYQL